MVKTGPAKNRTAQNRTACYDHGLGYCYSTDSDKASSSVFSTQFSNPVNQDQCHPVNPTRSIKYFESIAIADTEAYTAMSALHPSKSKACDDMVMEYSSLYVPLHLLFCLTLLQGSLSLAIDWFSSTRRHGAPILSVQSTSLHGDRY